MEGDTSYENVSIHSEGGMDSPDEVGTVEKQWKFFGQKIPKPEFIFFSQVVIIYIVVITALVNITIARGDGTVWISLLCSCLGYMLPNPSFPADGVGKLSENTFS